ncbi:MAG: peptidoglycan-binding protein [Clostridia bacterium]|nr:peptidoglycan-binding protein [Clostridia bacterium]MBQ9400915.1 peptidoglycan-binding protein [Clostridia bacterium]
MKKNPKVIAGVAALAVLVFLGAILLTQMIPTIGEVQLELSLTPTPLPQMPDSVWAEVVNPAEPTPEPPLSSGSRGEKVEELQKCLQALGYYDGEIDGQFGPGTKAAVVDFQKNNGLDTDGLAGTETLNLLYSQEAKPSPQQK